MAKRRKIKRRIQKTNVPKKCYFCIEKKEPTFKDTAVLQRFLTERAKIVPRLRSGLCTKHQKGLSVAVKHARQLALLPFIIKV